MELSIPRSSCAVPSTIPQRLKSSSCNDNRLKLIKPTTAKNNVKSSNVFPSKRPTNKSNLIPARLGKSRFSKSLLYCQLHERNSIEVRAEVESGGDSDSVFAKISRFGSTYYKFMRPYGMLYAIISATCLFARVFIEDPRLFTWSVLFKAFCGLIACIFAGAYVNGINQIYDIDIDRVNKAYLSIPAGDLSLTQAWFLVMFDLAASVLILRFMKPDLITTSLAFLFLFLGTFYSAPPFRFKRSSIATIIVLPLASCVIHNVGILYTTRASLGLPFLWSPPVVFITTFGTLFSMVLSITKDIVDVKGDMKFNIRTFAAIFGSRNIAFVGTVLLLVNYTGAIVAGIYMPRFNCYYEVNY
ncbi:homogentisate solanesyltransferase, chloroplastic-like [Morus notabilis]|uniref:homogentisate solanesyltransferase, chloroplastic-like n=1 Tax=Morus notabilis TaxID=981085 RepID=UPI000CED4D32|nr:homogentisate solanesyltransferase, chloroplastic-like [Morus notabilis]